ncbi:glutathione S-transferase [Chloropicon primus]|uniref:Glutathione S-transferase n=1 Tax=Chloropicon primus TaxID=1764295 RepID=A0A5B8MHN6_9CHLO|nr:glutathione S-transferase [Chloropicon primus]UPQ99002.1 glutathione S-transferase [Chloropicon primus]|eukprot:QDZ19791.1 glutathione S-transferase [Chloropicon primus]
MRAAMTWEQLDAHVEKTGLLAGDRVNGPTNAQARLRLFGGDEDAVRVTLYRDNHAWCPYCQKVWLWLEEKRVPYRIEKVTMFCYGEKEAWYKRKVPSGMLPALEIDGRLYTESDVILSELERAFGPLHKGMSDPAVVPLRRLERTLFSAWCQWLCSPNWFPGEEKRARQNFERVVSMVEEALSSTPGGFFLEEFSTADAVFTPYVERMNASLFYYKGYLLRDPEQNPNMARWFDAMETRETYRGTQSDFHTHSHDLPPQMGGCYENNEPEQQSCKSLVDCGPWADVPDVGFAEPSTAADEAVARTVKHRANIVRANPCEDDVADEALRCALTGLVNGELVTPPSGGDVALRYIRDRVNVPRDMSLHAARRMRTALEATAALAGSGEGPPIPTSHRRDQDPRAFQ